jgi:hypothetical protein
MKAELSQDFLSNIISVNRYVSAINGINLDSKKIIFSFKKVGASYLYYISNGIFAKAELAEAVVDSDENYEVDYDKFLHLVNNTSGGVAIEVVDSTMKVTTDVAVVDLLCTSISETDAMMDLVSSNDESLYSDVVQLNESTIAGMAMTNSLISQSKNNAGALFEDKVMYSDRSQIYHKELSEESNSGLLPDDGLVLHKNIFVILTNLFKFNKLNLASVSLAKKPKKVDSFVIKDDKVTIFISNSQAEVSLPTDADLENIRPLFHSFSLSKEVLDELINFFSGFFIGNSWKPLTFVNNNEELEIQYSVPSVTNISRKVGSLNPGSSWTKFVIDSDSLKNFVSKLANEFEFYVEEDKLGVLIKNGNDNIIFAKLV